MLGDEVISKKLSFSKNSCVLHFTREVIGNFKIKEELNPIVNITPKLTKEGLYLNVFIPRIKQEDK